MFDQTDGCALPKYVLILLTTRDLLPAKLLGVNEVGIMAGLVLKASAEVNFIPWTQVASLLIDYKTAKSLYENLLKETQNG